MYKSIEIRFLSSVIVFLGLIGIMGIYYFQKINIEKNCVNHIANYSHSFDSHIEESAHMMESYLKLIEEKKDLQSLFKASNKEELFKNSEKILKHLNTNSDITHFYFIKPDGKILLRVHDINQSGDVVERYTFLKAKETKKTFYGLEFGIKKNYTLRVVTPWIVDGELIGYIELGKEIDKISKTLSKQEGVEILYAVSKSQFTNDEKAIQERLQKMMQIEDCYIVYNTLPVSLELVDFLKNNDNDMKWLEINNRFYVRYIEDLVDVSKKSLGLKIILIDVTELHSELIASVKSYIAVFGIVVFLIFILLFLYQNYQKNRKLNTIIQEVDSGIGLIDLEGNFLEVNEMYVFFLGYEKEELLTKNCIDLTIPEEQEKFKYRLEQAKNNKKVSNIKKTWKRKDGSHITLEFSLILMPLSNELSVVIHSLEETIKLEQLNQTLEERLEKKIEEEKVKDAVILEKTKLASMGEMVDAIAHQWINPLGVIRMYAQQAELFLESDSFDKNEIVFFQNKILLQVDHLVETISEFRNFFRPNTELYEVEIISVVNSVLKLMKDELIKNCIEVEITGDRTLRINIIPNEFKHVLINLFNNSKDAFNEKGIQNRKIIVHILKQDNVKIVQIYDNAGGILETIIKHIFESNFTTKLDGKGTGIGLYMTKQIVEKIGGTIEVENVILENQKGTMFVIKF